MKRLCHGASVGRAERATELPTGMNLGYTSSGLSSKSKAEALCHNLKDENLPDFTVPP